MLTDILSKLKQNTKIVTIFVPSANRFVQFNQLSAKQQKDLIKTGLDGASSSLTTSSAINDVIVANSVDYKDFNVFDKLPVILALRISSLGTTCKLDDKEIDLSDFVSKRLSFNIPYSTQVKLDEITVSVRVPTLQEDTAMNVNTKSVIDNDKDIAFSDAVNLIFSYEILKFIDDLQITGCEFKYSELSLSDKLTIIDALPATVVKKIIDYIQQFRIEETNYMTHNGEVLSIDARLFS